MKPHPRIRKAIKWGGAALCVFILVVWGASGWWWVQAYASNGWVGSVFAGRLAIGTYALPVPWTTSIRMAAVSKPPEFFWWFDLESYSGDGYIEIPLWAIAAPLAGITAIAWRLDTLARRRARAGLCPKCRYDRAGLAPGAVCPECGAAAHPPAPAA